jgi:hypothetical protein
MTSREFNQDAGRATKAANEGPAFIINRGRSAHVLMSIEDYRRLTGAEMSLLEAVAQPDADFDFDPPRLGKLFSVPVLD